MSEGGRFSSAGSGCKNARSHGGREGAEGAGRGGEIWEKEHDFESELHKHALRYSEPAESAPACQGGPCMLVFACLVVASLNITTAEACSGLQLGMSFACSPLCLDRRLRTRAS